MKTTASGCLRWGGLLALLLTAAGVRAEAIQWRSDYNAARQEAARGGRLLVIDLGTENCYWCRELDNRTFRDAAVIALLNQRCVPLRVDGNRSQALADALRVQSYPTLVLAAPDGKVLGYQEGFIEAGPFRDQLTRALAAMAAEQGRAARTEPRGDDRTQGLLTARPSVAAPPSGAAPRPAPAVDAPRPAPPFDAAADQRTQRARDLLLSAKEDFRTQQFLCCLDRCETLAGQFADLPEGAEGARLADEIKANPDWARQACDQMNDRLGVLYLSQAEYYVKNGQPQQAVFYLEQVLRICPPGSRYVETAQTRLTQLQGQPAPGRAAEPKH